MPIKLEIPILKVTQWLKEWNDVRFDDKKHKDNRKKPIPTFYLFTIKAGLLKKLSKVYPRRIDEKREIEIGIQRKHDPERSEEIARYIKNGYPLSELMKNKSSKYDDMYDLRMPGWLPTAIVANILVKDTERGQNKIAELDLIKIDNIKSKLILPKAVLKTNWTPKVPPIEIIDGQHRLWAFNSKDGISDEYELPVVAFYDLDITWQAYLFYTINIKPKKINRSLAYDLYPLLRVQEWLEKAPDTAFVYKETRAQELVELLWSFDKSPWKNMINMLGETKSVANITQAAFIRNLIASFIKTSNIKGLGGLFGSKLNDRFNSPLSWNRTQQASFLIFVWQIMYEKILKCQEDWAKSLRRVDSTDNLFKDIESNKLDLAFTSRYSLITTDQGVRGFLHIVNDMIFQLSNTLNLRNISWSISEESIKEGKIDFKDIEKAIKDLKKSILNNILIKLCDELIKFDWRTSSEPHLSDEQRRAHMVFKGSSGYKELRSQLLKELLKSKDHEIKNTAVKIWENLGYAD